MKLRFKTKLEEKEGKVYVNWLLVERIKPFYAKIIKNEIESFFFKETDLDYSTAYSSSLVAGSFTVEVEEFRELEGIQELIDNILLNIEDIVKYHLIILPRKVIRIKKNIQGTTTIVVPAKSFLKTLS